MNSENSDIETETPEIPVEEIYAHPTSEMIQAQTYIDYGWDFDSIWTIDEGVGYPYFQWEDRMDFSEFNDRSSAK